MIRLVTGAPGSGKTFTCVHVLFKEYVFNSDRDIVTNLPINLTEFFKLYNVKPAREEQIRKRIVFLKDRFSESTGTRVFTILPSGEEIPREDDHDELYPHAQTRSETFTLQRPEILNRKKEVLVPENKFHEIREFWRFGNSGSVYMIDEIGKYASALDRESRSNELSTYLSQHRHYHDDAYFICQKVSQIDKQIRDQIEKRYVVQRSTSTAMIKSKIFGQMDWPVLFFMLCEITADPLSERDFKNGEIGRRWTAWPSKKKFKCYNSYSKSDGLDGKGDAAKKGDDQNAGKQNVKNAFVRNQWRWISLIVIVIVVWIVAKSYLDWALGDHKATARQNEVQETQPKELATSRPGIEPAEVLASQKIEAVEEKKPSHISIRNPGLTHNEVKDIFEGGGYILGEMIIVSEEYAELAQEIEKHGRKERPHYARFLVVRFRDWEGVDLQTIQEVRLRATSEGTKLLFDLEYKGANVAPDYEIMTLLDAVLMAGRPLVIQNGKVLREDQASSAENGRVFTSGKIEEEIGLKFEFTPYQYPEKRIIRGSMVLDDTTGDTLDETTKSAMESWVELTPDLRLVGSVTREYTRVDSDTVIPLTGFVPLLNRWRWSNEVQVKELLAVYAQHFPDEPTGSTLPAEASEVMRSMAAGQYMYEMLPIEKYMREVSSLPDASKLEESIPIE